jgi:hypothetical protein
MCTEVRKDLVPLEPPLGLLPWNGSRILVVGRELGLFSFMLGANSFLPWWGLRKCFHSFPISILGLLSTCSRGRKAADGKSS